MAIRNNLDDIVNVDIEISTPGSSDESFNNVLLVVEGPVVGKKCNRNISYRQCYSLLSLISSAFPF